MSNLYGGAGIKAFAEAIEKDGPQSVRDWSIELAYHLAGALIAFTKLKEAEVQTTYRRKRLIEPALEDAWRELIFIRQRYVPDEIALNDIARRVTLSKLGRIMIDDSEDQDNIGRRQSNRRNSSKTRQRLYRRGDRPRYRRRVTTKPIE